MFHKTTYHVALPIELLGQINAQDSIRTNDTRLPKQNFAEVVFIWVGEGNRNLITELAIQRTNRCATPTYKMPYSELHIGTPHQLSHYCFTLVLPNVGKLASFSHLRFSGTRHILLYNCSTNWATSANALDEIWIHNTLFHFNGCCLCLF